MLRLELQVVELVLLDKDVMPLRVFISFDDFVLGYFLEAVLGFDALCIFDGLATRLVDMRKEIAASVETAVVLDL